MRLTGSDQQREATPRTLGVVLQDLHNPIFGEIVYGVRDAADKAGYHVIITTGRARPEVEMESIETFLALGMAGIIVVAPLMADAQLAAMGRAVPLALVGRELASATLDSVHTNEYIGARLAVEHLQGLGHEDIAYIDIAEGAEEPYNAERRAGYHDAMRDAGLSARIRAIRAGPAHDGSVAFRRILAAGNVPTALFVYNDLAALAVQDECVHSGFEVPDEISLVGFDNTFLAGLEHVSLTSVDQQARHTGGLAVEFVLERLAGRTEPRHEIVAPTLVTRDSTARCSTRERRAALTLQHSLMPQGLSAGSALDVASRYVPANAPSSAGGDWFDVIPVSGARVALVVGDVVGHGTNAAAAMGLLRTAVRTLAALDLPPDDLLAHLDDLVISLGEESARRTVDNEQRDVAASVLGATCLYAVYDPVAESCTVARAGHPPPAIVAVDGSVTFPDLPAGPPLGLGFLPFGSAELELPRGTLLALYTDGLVEARDWDIEVGMSHLADALTDAGPMLDEVCDKVVAALVKSSPPDDAALLVARPHGLDGARVATLELSTDPAVVAGARALANRKLTEWGLEELQFTTELLVSELVTNAIRYAGAPIRLRLIHQPDVLICEVFDASSTSPRMRHARATDEGGRGLFIVAQLTQRWGTRYTAAGKVIWAEQRTPPSATASVPALP
ncbi:SpoIIE family protein phosphatase [Streptomyces sp. NPDC019531]|uniref:SpoIIE family protein phosphatase n=1 Tax=Streptomyces sp. NPDC019531 TaxID=3365062 RepID=UPI00384D022B